MAVKIIKVETKDDLKKFVKFNIDLYKDSPFFVPDIIENEVKMMTKDYNPVLEDCDYQYFIAYKDERVVGRIAGIINNLSNETWNSCIARFGFVDFINDNEVVDELFSAVFSWSKSKGMEVIQGPMGFSNIDKEGVLIKGYDQMGTLSTIYNYAYYPKQFERIGFVKNKDWNEYRMTIPNSVPDSIRILSEKIKIKYGIRPVRISKKQDLEKYINPIFDTINKAYSFSYGYNALTDRQMEFYTRIYFKYINPDYVSIIVRESDNTVVGFALTSPNLSNGFRKANGSMFPLGWLHIMKDLKAKGNDVVDLYMLAVLPEYQNKGITSVIMSDLIPRYVKNGIRYMETNPWVEASESIRLQWNYFDKIHHKTRRAYVKLL